MDKLKYKNGDIVNGLIIVGRENRKYLLKCPICSDDTELYGDGIFRATGDYLGTDKKPCGCSRSPKRSEYQWRVLIKRKSVESDCNFIDFVGGKYIDQDTKLQLACNSCNHEWDSCSTSNFMRDRKCPKCADNKRGYDKLTNDSEWIERFFNSKQFDRNIYLFTRTTPTARLWSVYCKTCDDSFLSDRSNLVAGKVPCNCGKGGGYDKSKTGYFYILKCKQGDKEFIKYGITNFLRRRIVSHKRTTKDFKVEIIEQLSFEGDGTSVLQLESHLKRSLIFLKDCCFRRETCTIDNLESILKQVDELGFKQV